MPDFLPIFPQVYLEEMCGHENDTIQRLSNLYREVLGKVEDFAGFGIFQINTNDRNRS